MRKIREIYRISQITHHFIVDSSDALFQVPKSMAAEAGEAYTGPQTSNWILEENERERGEMGGGGNVFFTWAP